MLTLSKLTIENFKKHEYVSLDFTDGLNVIVGPNYAGKSSILHAALFALFGASAVPGGSKVLPRRGTKNSTKVTLEGYFNGRPLTLERTLTSARLDIDGNTEAFGTSPVSDAVTELLLKVDKDIALSLGYSEQSETASLLTLGVAKTNSLIETVSNVDYIDKLVAKASKLSLAHEKEADKYETFKELVEKVSSELEEAVESLKEAQDSFNSLKPVSEEVEVEYEKELKIYTKLKDDREKFKEHEKELGRVSAAKEAAEASHKKAVSVLEEKYGSDWTSLEKSLLESREKAKDCISELAESKETTYKEHAKAVQAIKDLETSFNSAKDTYLKLEEQSTKYSNVPPVGDLPEKIEIKFEAVTKLRLEISELKNKARSKKSELESSICSACNRPFENFDREKLSSELKEIEEKYLSAVQREKSEQSELSEMKASLESLTKQQPPKDFYERLDQAKEAYELLTKRHLLELPSLETVKQVTFDSYETVKSLMEAWQEKLTNASNSLYEFRTKKEQALSLEESFKKASEKYKEVLLKGVNLQEVSEEEVSEKEQKVSKIRAKLAEASEAVKVIRANLSHWTNLKAKRQEDLKELELKIKKSEASAAKVKELSAFVKWLKSNKTNFMQNIWNGIMAFTSDFSRTATSGRLENIVRATDTGQFYFYEEGEEIPLPVAGAASGGQKAIMGTALKVALSQYLPQGFGFMLLDEPSSELNQEHTSMLSTALKATGQQIILVSHREADELTCDNLIEV